MTCHTARKPYYRAIGAGAVVLYPDHWNEQTPRERELGCNVDFLDPNQPEPPRVLLPDARKAGAPCSLSPARRAHFFSRDAVPPSRVTGAGSRLLRSKSERGTGALSDHAQDVAALAAAGFVILIALLIYTLLGGQS